MKVNVKVECKENYFDILFSKFCKLYGECSIECPKTLSKGELFYDFDFGKSLIIDLENRTENWFEEKLRSICTPINSKEPSTWNIKAEITYQYFDLPKKGIAFY